jgi:hypothetical protein
MTNKNSSEREKTKVRLNTIAEREEEVSMGVGDERHK